MSPVGTNIDNEYFWLGGTDVAEHNVWKWTDGSDGMVDFYKLI